MKQTDSSTYDKEVLKWFTDNRNKPDIQILTVKALSYFGEVKIEKTYLEKVIYLYLTELLDKCEDQEVIANLPYFKDFNFPIFIKSNNPRTKYYVPVDIADKFLENYDDSLDSFYKVLKVLFDMIENVEYQEIIVNHVRRMFVQKASCIPFQDQEKIYKNNIIPNFSFEEKYR